MKDLAKEPAAATPETPVLHYMAMYLHIVVAGEDLLYGDFKALAVTQQDIAIK